MELWVWNHHEITWSWGLCCFRVVPRMIFSQPNFSIFFSGFRDGKKFPFFKSAGQCEYDQLRCITKIVGLPPKEQPSLPPFFGRMRRWGRGWYPVGWWFQTPFLLSIFALLPGEMNWIWERYSFQMAWNVELLMVQKSPDLQRFLLTYISQLVRDFWNTGRRVWQKIWLTRWVATPPGKMKVKMYTQNGKRGRYTVENLRPLHPKNHPIFFMEKSSEPNLPWLCSKLKKHVTVIFQFFFSIWTSFFSSNFQPMNFHHFKIQKIKSLTLALWKRRQTCVRHHFLLVGYPPWNKHRDFFSDENWNCSFQEWAFCKPENSHHIKLDPCKRRF